MKRATAAALSLATIDVACASLCTCLARLPVPGPVAVLLWGFSLLFIVLAASLVGSLWRKHP